MKFNLLECSGKFSFFRIAQIVRSCTARAHLSSFILQIALGIYKCSWRAFRGVITVCFDRPCQLAGSTAFWQDMNATAAGSPRMKLLVQFQMASTHTHTQLQNLG